MEHLEEFFKEHGLALGLIALGGVIILGILKYCKVFEKVDEKYRHLIYIGITVAISLIASAVYLGVTKQFNVGSFFNLAVSIFAIDQGFYALYANCGLKELLNKILDKLFNRSSSTTSSTDEETKENTEDDNKEE